MANTQIDAQIDWACITSVISCIECDSLDSPGKVVRDAALKATTALITNSTLRLAPPPQSAGMAVGAFDYIRHDLAKRLVSAGIKNNTRQDALDATQKWINSESTAIAKDFQELYENDEFKQWLDLEVRNIWVPHSVARDGLFDLSQKTLISKVTGLQPSDLDRLHTISRDPDKLREYADNKTATLEFDYLCRAYVGSFIVRSPYYDSIAQMTRRKVAHHELRTRYDSFLPNTVLPRTKEKTGSANWLYYLAGVILASAQREKTQRDRIAAYSRYLDEATSLYFQQRIPVPLGDEIGKTAIDEWLYDRAKQIGIHTRGKRFYQIINAACNIGPGILLLFFRPFIQFVVNSIFDATGAKEKLGRDVGGWFDTKSRILDLVKDLPPGRFELEWDKFD